MTDKLKVQQLSEYKNFIVKNNCVMIPIPDFDMLIDLAKKAATLKSFPGGASGNVFGKFQEIVIFDGVITKINSTCGIGYD